MRDEKLSGASVSSFSRADNCDVDLVKLRAAIVRVSWHFLEDDSKCFRCNVTSIQERDQCESIVF